MEKILGMRAKRNRCLKYIEETYPEIKYKDCSTETDVIFKLKTDETSSTITCSDRGKVIDNKRKRRSDRKDMSVPETVRNDTDEKCKKAAVSEEKGKDNKENDTDIKVLDYDKVFKFKPEDKVRIISDTENTVYEIDEIRWSAAGIEYVVRNGRYDRSTVSGNDLIKV